MNHKHLCIGALAALLGQPTLAGDSNNNAAPPSKMDVTLQLQMGALERDHEVTKYSYTPVPPGATQPGGTPGGGAATPAPSYDRTTTTDGWLGLSTAPIVGVLMKAGTLAVEADVTGAAFTQNLVVGGSFYVGRIFSKGLEMGLYSNVDYSSSHKSVSGGAPLESGSTVSANSNDQNSAQASRSLGVGPYARITVANAVEILPKLLYVHNSNEDSTFQESYTSRTGIGFELTSYLLLPLTRTITYMAGIDLTYSAYRTGATYEDNDATLMKGNLTSDVEYTYAVTLLGIRARL